MDPVRYVVQAGLVFYLSPVIALVCLIGIVSVVAGRARKSAGPIPGLIGRGPTLGRSAPDAPGRVGPRLAHGRRKSRAAR